MVRRRAQTVKVIPPAVRSYLLTGTYSPGEPGSGDLYQLRYGPFGTTREARLRRDSRNAFAPYRAQLRAEGLQPIHIEAIDGPVASQDETGRRA